MLYSEKFILKPIKIMTILQKAENIKYEWRCKESQTSVHSWWDCKNAASNMVAPQKLGERSATVDLTLSYIDMGSKELSQL